MFLTFFPLLTCYVIVAPALRADDIVPRPNVSVRWLSDFEPVLSWTPDDSSKHCSCTFFRETAEKDSMERHSCKNPSIEDYVAMGGGYLRYSVTTVCNNVSSSPKDVTIKYPELARDFQCAIILSTLTRCSWQPINHPPDFRFFFWFKSTISGEKTELQECPSYSDRDGVRTGCELQAKTHYTIYALFNGTLNDTLARNTFSIRLLRVAPPSLQWNVTMFQDKFLIKWFPPDLLSFSRWRFQINYTECDEAKVLQIKEETSVELNRISHCPYRISMKAVSNTGETQKGKDKHFDAEPNLAIYPSIVLPLVLTALTLLALISCRKYKGNIFTKIPKPSNLIPDNNNTNDVCNMYIPPKEEDCQVTLVLEPNLSPYLAQANTE
ncbi:uncharacterized protein ACBR49_019345 [Aulostomus maculatus]